MNAHSQFRCFFWPCAMLLLAAFASAAQDLPATSGDGSGQTGGSPNAGSPTPQTPTAAASGTSQPSSSGGLFGTTTDLESGVKSKGAELGVGKNEADEKKRSGEFAFAPIPLVNPSIGNGIGAALMYIVPLDSSPNSPPSTFALGGFGTGTGSWSGGLGAKLYLDDDRYRITAGAGLASLNYNFYGIGTSAGSEGVAIPLAQRSRGFLIEPMRRVFDKWYIGPRYHHISNHVSLNTDKLKAQFAGVLPPDVNIHLPVPLPDELNLATAALGLRIKRDSTDSLFYPRSGSLLDITMDFFDPAFGAQSSYRNYDVEFNKYIGLGAKNVLATHVSACAVTSNAPFYDVCLLGLSKDLRGYQIGQYRDDRMLDGQAEFRRELFWRLGAVAFAGVGEVAKTFGDFNTSNLIPGGGVGLRFKLTKRNHLNLRADYAWGKDSRAFYMSVGEAF
jgi:hypothetical protein